MRKLFLISLLSLASNWAHADVLITFDELSDYNGMAIPPGTGQYYDGYGFGAPAGSWSSQGAQFNTNEWGPGWSYSNVNDTVLEGFTNQWAAFTGTDVSGDGNYAIATSFAPNGAFFNLSVLSVIQSVYVTNTTWAALSMLNGDQFAKKFGGSSGNDPDWFKVTFTGFSDANASGSVTGFQEFYLADYRFADNSQDYIVSSWSLVSLITLGSVRSVGISLESSDSGQNGINTPAYVAIDNLLISVVPEPSSISLVALSGLLITVRRRLR